MAQQTGQPIERIVLTHAHGDHVGSLDRLATMLPGAEVSIGARDARLLAGDKTLDPSEPDDKLRGSYPGTTTRAHRTLEAGERVGSLEVIPAPGHTPGQIALLDTRDQTLLCADAFSSLGGVATTAKVNRASRFPRSPPGTGRRRSRPLARCARWNPPASPRDTGPLSRSRSPRWTPRYPRRSNRWQRRSRCAASTGAPD